MHKAYVSAPQKLPTYEGQAKELANRNLIIKKYKSIKNSSYYLIPDFAHKRLKV